MPGNTIPLLCRKTRLAISRQLFNFQHDWCGVVAQLVERLVRNEKVSGSIPLSSTSLRRCAASAGRPSRTAAKAALRSFSEGGHFLFSYAPRRGFGWQANQNREVHSQSSRADRARDRVILSSASSSSSRRLRDLRDTLHDGARAPALDGSRPLQRVSDRHPLGHRHSASPLTTATERA